MNPQDDAFFNETTTSVEELARAEASEALSRVLLWMADGRTLDECGFRCMTALSAIKPGIFNGATLEKLGLQAGRKPQAVGKLKEEFTKAFAL